MINEIVYDAYKNNGGSINTFTDTKKICIIIRNHLCGDGIKKALQANAPSLAKVESEDYFDKTHPTELVKSSHEEEENQISRNMSPEATKYIDSGNVSPESLQLSSFRDDSRLSNVTPPTVCTPENFIREDEDNEKNNMDSVLT